MSYSPCLTFYQDAKNLRHLFLSNLKTQKKRQNLNASSTYLLATVPLNFYFSFYNPFLL